MLYVRGRKWPRGTPRIIDLAPTILHLLGAPVPPELEGRALFAPAR
jgi:bisphosphoglycerate-independent phosphoglycerate mutase (AlkP superfamily)